ncbi:hypothetical protein ACN47E_003172 [Coniothyrium glycines]
MSNFEEDLGNFNAELREQLQTAIQEALESSTTLESLRSTKQLSGDTSPKSQSQTDFFSRNTKSSSSQQQVSAIVHSSSDPQIPTVVAAQEWLKQPHSTYSATPSSTKDTLTRGQISLSGDLRTLEFKSSDDGQEDWKLTFRDIVWLHLVHGRAHSPAQNTMPLNKAKQSIQIITRKLIKDITCDDVIDVTTFYLCLAQLWSFENES